MKVLVFTSGDEQEMRDAKDLGKRLESDGYTVEYLDPEMPECANLQELYNVTSYPSFVVTADDGSVVHIWRDSIPLEYDIKMFLQS
jgi:hypothetical protein